jgi:hypothetical protein
MDASRSGQTKELSSLPGLARSIMPGPDGDDRLLSSPKPNPNLDSWKKERNGRVSSARKEPM